jgi:ATP-dependent exoDNAse (exonuclease V) alpha subunit
MEKVSDGFLRKISSREDNLSLFNNSKGVVVSTEIVEVTLNRSLIIPAYKIKIKIDNETFDLYEPLDKGMKKRIDEYYKHHAWSQDTKQKKDKAFNEKHFITHCFANILHAYAGTTYRFQGMGIKNVIMICNDLKRVTNPVEQAKHFYVGVSRAKENLFEYWED